MTEQSSENLQHAARSVFQDDRIIRFLILLSALCGYSVVLVTGIFKPILAASRQDLFLFPIISALLLYLCLGLRGKTGTAITLTFMLILFALPQAQLWRTGSSDVFVLGGILPWSDAGDYYDNAEDLLNHSLMPADRRVLFSGMLSALLALFGRNLYVVVSILTVISGICCYLATREVQKTIGKLAATLVGICLFLYVRPFIGQTLTESLGFPLGTLAFALLLRGTHLLNPRIVLFGIFVLALAQNIRVGALLVLPALLIWGGFVFRNSKRFSFSFFLRGCAIVVFAFFLHFLVIKITCAPSEESPFANYGYTFYGLVTQTNWMHGYSMSEQRYQTALDMGMEIVRNNPSILLKSMFHSWANFLWGSFSIFFPNAPSTFPVFNQSVEIFLRPLFVLGLLFCFALSQQRIYSLIIACLAGIFISIGFVPYWDAGARPFAVTIIILFAVCAVGIEFLRLTFFMLFSRMTHPGTPLLQIKRTPALVWFALSLVAFIIFAPVFTKLLVSGSDSFSENCTEGSDVVHTRLKAGSVIHLMAPEQLKVTMVPNIVVDDFRAGLASFTNWPEERDALRNLNASTTVVDLARNEFLVINSNLVPQMGSEIYACGRRELVSPFLTLFRANSITVVKAR